MRGAPADIVRRVYEHWGEGDFTWGADLFDDASALVLGPEFPDTGVYVGPGEINRYMLGFLEPWQQLTITCVGLTELGDTVIAEVRQEGRGELSGAMTGFSYFQVWTFRGEIAVRMESFMRREQVEAALGR